MPQRAEWLGTGNWVPLERGGSQTGTMVYQDPDRDSAMRFYRVRVEEDGL